MLLSLLLLLLLSYLRQHITFLVIVRLYDVMYTAKHCYACSYDVVAVLTLRFLERWTAKFYCLLIFFNFVGFRSLYPNQTQLIPGPFGKGCSSTRFGQKYVDYPIVPGEPLDQGCRGVWSAAIGSSIGSSISYSESL